MKFLLNLIFTLIIFLQFFLIHSQSIVRKSEEIICYDKNCRNCTDDDYGSCIECKDDFKLVAGSCICHDPNCIECYSSYPYACYKCKTGFYLKYGSCRCEDSCDKCGETGCLVCYDRYMLTEDKHCVSNESSYIACFDPNCNSCSRKKNGTCYGCKDGYYLYKGKCVENPVCNKTKTKIYENGDSQLVYYDNCQSCPDGFYLSNERCYIKCGGANCTEKIYNSDYMRCSDNCYVCLNNVLKEYTNCKSTTCNDPNCIKCAIPDSCDICDFGYELVNGMCIENEVLINSNETHCISVDYDVLPGRCSYCMNNYDLNSEGKCIYNSTSQMLYSSNKNELAIPNCTEGYHLTSSNNCQKDCNVKHCKDCLSDNICVECEAGFKVKNNNCYMICSDPNCDICDGETNCTQCNDGYFLDTNTNKCKDCFDENCYSCNSSEEGHCIRCRSFFELIDGVCASSCYNNKDCSYCYKDKCLRCMEGCKYKKGACKCNQSLIILVIILASILLIVVVVFIYFCITKNRYYNERVREESGSSSIQIKMSSEELGKRFDDEFETTFNLSKINKQCDFCSNSLAVYNFSCGCYLCKTHSGKVKTNKDGEKSSDEKCVRCGKIKGAVKNTNPIKEKIKKKTCGICYDKKEKVAKFPCHCALDVCKDCYIKIGLMGNKCPACRAEIY